MKTFKIIHLGLGNVGKELARQLFSQQKHVLKKYAVELHYIACFSSNRGLLGSPLSNAQVMNFPKNSTQTSVMEVAKEADTSTILVDTTSSVNTVPTMKTVLNKGGYVVMANKKPFSAEYSIFSELYNKYPGHIYFETTVGAGLPILRPLLYLLDSGDIMIRIEGCFSGTLGYLCSQLEAGIPYSQAVKKAKELGYTEPDPRDDLSGMDVARKALILARVSGIKKELSDIQITPFFNPALASLSIDDFLGKLSGEDKKYAAMFRKASDHGNTYRYVASISNDSISVGLKEVSKQSPLGSLKGPENKVVIQTERYSQYPLVVQGPGAGAAVTAAGLFSDILAIATH